MDYSFNVEHISAFDAEHKKVAMYEFMKECRRRGLDGWRGRCAHTAVLMNRKIFAGSGQLMGILNKFFWQKGHMAGHIFVSDSGEFWDIDGVPKRKEDIVPNCLLDSASYYWEEMAKELGAKRWNDKLAQTVQLVSLDEDEVLDYWGEIPSHMERAIEGAIEHVSRVGLSSIATAKKPKNKRVSFST